MSTVCKLKWNWSTVMLHSGQTSSCYKSTRCNITLSNVIEFHNLKEKQQQRQVMLDGQWPSGCHWCEDVEKVGATSDRIIHNRHWGGVNDIEQANSTVGKLDVLELYLDNTCNFSCIYCDSKFSNTWSRELEKFGPISIGSTTLKPFNYDKNLQQDLLKKLWDWLPNNLAELKELNILGGEPLLLEETFSLLSLIEQHGSTNLDLTIFSNLGVPNKLIKRLITQLERLLINKKLRSAKIMASIDSWGPDIEFQRYGLDLGRFEQNIETILESRIVKLGFNSTITCLSVNTLPVFLEKWLEWRKRKQIHLSLGSVEHWGAFYCLSVNALPYGLLEQSFNRALALIPQDIDSDKLTHDRLQGIRDYSKNSSRNTELLPELKRYLTELSRRRNINWQDYYPWLIDILKDV